MRLSIITPHYNDHEGLRHIYGCLLQQTVGSWEWIVIDDFSEKEIRQALTDWYQDLDDSKVRVILNPSKTNASVCRNTGADAAAYEHLVFLDADDVITEHFVAHRQIDFEDFAIFPNTATIDNKGIVEFSSKIKAPYLNYFLKAQFIWPITSILWHKPFFNSLGRFHPELKRLQDVELAIRALQQSTQYKVFNTPVDFYYKVKPIRMRNNFVRPVCDSVYVFINELLNIRQLKKNQLSLLSGYYYTCTRYLERSENTKEIVLVHRNLKLFYKKGYISLQNYIMGYTVLKLYALHLISGKQFLRINRYLFKPKAV